MTEEFGALADLVKTVGALSSAAFAIGLTWRGRTRWEPAEVDLSKAPQKVGGLVTSVLVGLLWATNSDTSRVPFLTMVSITSAAVCIIGMIAYGILIATHVFNSKASGVEVKIIGGFTLNPQARRIIYSKNNFRTIQEYLSDVGFDPDKVWNRFSRALAKATFVVGYLTLTISGTISISAVAMIILLTKTSLPIPVEKKLVHIAIVLNGDVHYTRDVMEGFRSGLDMSLRQTAYVAHYEHSIGFPEKESREQNAAVFSSLIKKFPRTPDYLVTIGTGVSEFANKAYKGKIPLIFAAVTDPIKSKIVTSYDPDENRGEIAGSAYGMSPNKFLGILCQSFPGKRFGFVRGFDISQDNYLKEFLFSGDGVSTLQSHRCSVVDIPVASFAISPEQSESADIFFGRYTVSTHIEQFVASTNKPFVGASAMNVYQGAILSLGADDREEGRRLGAEILAPNIIKATPLWKFPILTEPTAVIGINYKAARSKGIEIPDGLSKVATIKVYE